MDHSNARNGNGWRATFLDAIVNSWIGWTLLWVYVTLNFTLDHHDPQAMYWLGGMALATILFAMLGLSRTELWWTSRSPEWFRQHPLAKRLHHIHNEGEVAGIVVAVIVAGFQLARGEHVHLAFAEGFTLGGIMSAANMAARKMMPIMAVFERRFGVFGALVIGSVISSLTGEPAAAIFLSEYFKSRVVSGRKNRVATGLGATIGSGGGLMPFSAPPILIVWAILRSEFGWGYGHLLLFVGIACVFHVAIVAWRLRHHLLQAKTTKRQEKTSLVSCWPLLLLAIVVGLNISYEFHHNPWVVWPVDGLVIVWQLVWALRNRSKTHSALESEGHEQEGRHWQPLTLGLLLMGLEIVGHEAEPLLLMIAGGIPMWLPVWCIALILWYATAFTSHFADNALASRIYITVAVALSQTLGFGHLLATSVVLGALFGGFLLIPANLPNFAIAAEFRVNPKEWFRAAYLWYPSGVIHIAWIIGFYLVCLALQ